MRELALECETWLRGALAQPFDGGQVARMIGTHIGLNPKAQQQMLGKQTAIDLIKQQLAAFAKFIRRVRV